MNIPKIQIDTFLELLRNIDNSNGIIDFKNLDDVLSRKLKYQFPPKEHSALISIIAKNKEDELKKINSSIPLVAISSAPNHLSQVANILELKITQTLNQGQMKAEFLAFISVFPGGRMIFGLDGLNLDSNGKNLFFNEERVKRDIHFYKENEFIKFFRKEMLRAFKSNQTNSLHLKEEVLKLFEDTLPENN